MALEKAYQEQQAFELSGPWPDGKISVHHEGECLVAAKLRYEHGQWEHSLGNTTYVDRETKAFIVDIRAAVAKANEKFPRGPERKVA